MEKKLSKHGKYWIITGTPEELYDEMQPGDIVKDFEGDWFELLHVADFADMSQALQLITWLFHPDSVWWVRDMEDGTEKYLPFDKNDYVLKIKRPVADDPIPGNYTPLGTLTGDATFTEKPEGEVPDKPGLYKNSYGDYMLFLNVEGSDEMHYSWFGLWGSLLNETLCMKPVSSRDDLGGFAPYTRVISIKDVQLEQEPMPESKKEEPEATEQKPEPDEKELPEEQGLCTDSVGCLWLFVYEDCVMRRYFYSTITHRMLLDINGGIAKKSAPFRLVKSLEQEVD